MLFGYLMQFRSVFRFELGLELTGQQKLIISEKVLIFLCCLPQMNKSVDVLSSIRNRKICGRSCVSWARFAGRINNHVPPHRLSSCSCSGILAVVVTNTWEHKVHSKKQTYSITNALGVGTVWKTWPCLSSGWVGYLPSLELDINLTSPCKNHVGLNYQLFRELDLVKAVDDLKLFRLCYGHQKHHFAKGPYLPSLSWAYQ